jgi:hypothetical protein
MSGGLGPTVRPQVDLTQRTRRRPGWLPARSNRLSKPFRAPKKPFSFFIVASGAGPIVLRPARALAQVGRLLEITSYLCLFYLDLLLSDQPVDQADGGWRSASSRSDEGKLFEGRV